MLEDAAVRDQLVRKFFQENEWSAKLQTAKPSKLRTIGELRVTFSQKPWSFEDFYQRLDVLMSDWCSSVFEEPRLNSFYFPDEVVGEESAEIINRLREARSALMRSGEDPLHEIVRLANTVAPARTPTDSPQRSRSRSRRNSGMYKRKKSATHLQFEDSEGDIDSDDPNGDGTHHLSSLPNRSVIPGADTEEENSPRKKLRSQDKKYDGKRAWTLQEKTAIVEGIRQIGIGKWAMIKENYHVLFELRTSGQIKVGKGDDGADVVFPLTAAV